MGETNSGFSDDFMNSLVPSGENDQHDQYDSKVSDETIQFETCVGEGCHEKKIVVGSEGFGSVGLLTYCGDCFLIN